jgi:RNase adaptor protein for sRNA GlmZ degradation
MMGNRVSSHTAKVNIVSFGRVTVTPPGPKYSIDVTGLRDPSCQFAKTHKDGRSPDIQAWLRADPRVDIIVREIKQLCAVHLDSMKETYLSIGFVDHHGKWIAPAIAEIVAAEILYTVSVEHRELKP